MRILLLALFLLALLPLSAQRFWLTTYEFILGPKTGIASQGDSTLYVSGVYGMTKSTNRGRRFEVLLLSSPLHCVLVMKNGFVLAGGTGKIFRSEDGGASWDSISLETTFPVHQLIEHADGGIFGITASYVNGYEGDGVFYSPDGGITWNQRNNGLRNYACIERIAVDKNGRLYVAAADEFSTGNAGLFVSDDLGLQWRHVEMRVETGVNMPEKVKVTNTLGLSISPEDTVYYGLTAVITNFAAYGNLKKHIQDVTTDALWIPEYSRPPVYWWENPELNNIHFAKNGDQYSSFHRLLSIGGTYFKKAGSTWRNTKQGLGYDILGFYNIQHFTEMPDGAIYMVQTYDERVYVTDTSMLTSIRTPGGPVELPYTIYPNPVLPDGQIHLEAAESMTASYRIAILDMQGRLLSKLTARGSTSIQAPAIPGIYLLTLSSDEGVHTLKLIVAGKE